MKRLRNVLIAKIMALVLVSVLLSPGTVYLTMAAAVNRVSDGIFSQYLESQAAALEDYLDFEYGQITVLTGENHAAVDRFSESTGLVATVFRLEGDEYIRESTSIRDESDERATGTSASLLERNDKVMDVLQSLSVSAQENAAGTEEASAPWRNFPLPQNRWPPPPDR